MEKRVIFKGWWLPALLVAPQLIISFLFFFYPSGQALYYGRLFLVFGAAEFDGFQHR